jgi:hypothetical protein
MIYLLLKENKTIKKWSLLILPLLPYVLYLFFTGFQDIQLYRLFLKVTNPTNYSWIPYAKFPTSFFIIGAFGPGFISCILMWKNLRKEKRFKSFLIFSLILYLCWEILYDFVIAANTPKYHTTLVPFLTLIISKASMKNEISKYIYYLTLVYTLSTGFVIAYYFHISELAIWKYFFTG